MTSVQPTVTHVISMPFVTTQMDLTNAAAILGSLEMDKPALVKIIVIVVVVSPVSWLSITRMICLVFFSEPGKFCLFLFHSTCQAFLHLLYL